MNIKAGKTRLVGMKGGFDFLGLNFFHKPNGPSASKPKKGWLDGTKRKIRSLIKTSGMPKDKLVQKRHGIANGKRRFYQYSDLGKAGKEWWELDQYVYHKLGMGLPELKYKTNRHIKVKGEKSPYNGDWRYWVQRNSRRYEGNVRTQVFKRQGGKCGMCGLYMIENMEIHLHHKDHNHTNNKLPNLQWVHRACHMLHHRTRPTAPPSHL